MLLVTAAGFLSRQKRTEGILRGLLSPHPISSSFERALTEFDVFTGLRGGLQLGVLTSFGTAWRTPSDLTGPFFDEIREELAIQQPLGRHVSSHVTWFDLSGLPKGTFWEY